ncbi:proline--tRNA ligase [Ureibacillus sp. MALMAid1270]|uniref:proline--tRNA ligase n=1 Tax=Ureibacillus sp. MALMAid1270 TaxID=3411629 RepID=UPI003BA55441
MKQSLSFIRTNYEVPSNQLTNSNNLLERAGYIHLQNGRFISYLPLAKRVLFKIEKLIREEMNRLQANEISLPILNSFQQERPSNDAVSKNVELFHIQNRKSEELYLAPSHEEILTSIVKEQIKSYKQLPLVLYQIQTKFRDELEQNGLFKSLEFIMKDAYSFHNSKESLDEFYGKMEQAYSTIFSRLGLTYKKVVADLGNYCGEISHEFIVLSENGDVTIAYSNESDYAVNIDLAEVITQHFTHAEELKELKKQKFSIDPDKDEDILNQLELPPEKIIKTKTYKINDELLVVLYRGDHQLNEVKLKNLLHVKNLTLADDDFTREIIGCSVNSVGPIKLPVQVKVIADNGIKSISNGVACANEDGYYYENVNPERDFAINAYEDIRYIQEGEPSPDGIGTIQFAKGFEVAHIFKLGSTYSVESEALFVDEFGDKKPLQMGAYGLGVSRLFAVASQFYQDGSGFTWPNSIAPFDVHLLTENVENEEEWLVSEQLYNILSTYQFDVLFDDRHTTIDEKLNDANLIGLPVQVIVSSKVQQGIVKVQYRRTGETFECAKEELIDRLNEYFRVY